MGNGRWPLAGLIAGAVAGALWGYLGNDYESLDSAIGTSLICAVAGFLLGTIAAAVSHIRHR